MNELDQQYKNLLQDILDNGVNKDTRNGKVLSVFGRQIRHKMSEGFPILTTKKVSLKTVIVELLWFLRGDTNIKYLVDNNCNIWNGDAYKSFSNSFPIKKSNPPKDYINENGQLLTEKEFINEIKTNDEFAKKWGELGPIYGAQWRSWEYGEVKGFKNGKVYPSGEYDYDFKKESIDQIKNLINDLKNNPDSRRLMVNAWNVGELENMTLPPCHYGFQVYTRELSLEERCEINSKRDGTRNTSSQEISAFGSREVKKWMDDKNIPTRAISLMYNARSQDFPLGTPFNLASYSLLLEILAKEVNMIPDELITNMGDCHIYLNQINGVKEQLTREPYKLPTLKISNVEVNDICEYKIEDFTLENYQSHPTIKMPLSN